PLAAVLAVVEAGADQRNLAAITEVLVPLEPWWDVEGDRARGGNADRRRSARRCLLTLSDRRSGGRRAGRGPARGARGKDATEEEPRHSRPKSHGEPPCSS